VASPPGRSASTSQPTTPRCAAPSTAAATAAGGILCSKTAWDAATAAPGAGALEGARSPAAALVKLLLCRVVLSGTTVLGTGGESCVLWEGTRVAYPEYVVTLADV
jgi:hypothetical protein